MLAERGFEQGGAPQCASKAPVGLCLARGRIPWPIKQENHAKPRYGPFCFMLAERGFEQGGAPQCASKAPVGLCLARGRIPWPIKQCPLARTRFYKVRCRAGLRHGAGVVFIVYLFSLMEAQTLPASSVAVPPFVLSGGLFPAAFVITSLSLSVIFWP